ncbi:MAG: hypothetical protein MI799_11780, partial [Desulfobacterales bacterium]|nr:hypothetical protein [Desulfobacterales bacterium]
MTAYSRMSVLFSVCLYITLTPLISGCATSGDLNHQPRTHPTPVDLVDTWAIALHDGVRGSVEIDSGEFLLSLSGLNRSAYGTVKGIFKGYTQSGFPYFEFTNGNLIDSRLNTRSAVPTLSSANGFRIVNPYGSTTKNSDYSSIQFTLNGEIMRTHQGSISRVRYAEGYNKIRLRQRD